MICVDPLRSTGKMGMFRIACHLFSDDSDTEELRAFAQAIGLKWEWFQDTKTPHYDLSPSKRIAAIENGAVEVPRRYIANLPSYTANAEEV